MSSRTGRSYRRRKTRLELDLNRPPVPGENREGEGTSTQQVTIDLDAIDDDVVESSPRAFAQAKTNARRIRRRTVVDLDSEDVTWVAANSCRCGRDSRNQATTNCNLYINLEGSSSPVKENTRKSPEPPKEPVFNCPICMGPLTEEMSTKCGHIFCKQCIYTALGAQAKCPTCRKRVTSRELRRVFLPAAS